MKTKHTQPARPTADVIATRKAAREAMAALGSYGMRDIAFWNMAEIEIHARVLLAAAEFFNSTGTK